MKRIYSLLEASQESYFVGGVGCIVLYLQPTKTHRKTTMEERKSTTSLGTTILLFIVISSIYIQKTFKKRRFPEIHRGCCGGITLLKKEISYGCRELKIRSTVPEVSYRCWVSMCHAEKLTAKKHLFTCSTLMRIEIRKSWIILIPEAKTEAMWKERSNLHLWFQVYVINLLFYGLQNDDHTKSASVMVLKQMAFKSSHTPDPVDLCQAIQETADDQRVSGTILILITSFPLASRYLLPDSMPTCEGLTELSISHKKSPSKYSAPRGISGLQHRSNEIILDDVQVPDEI
ncbi:uncharacterized protein BDR25DRAFT_356785 [Lindgomyces ingoldianus]|uniref:Uncharacterized protein n=1 Tax=Lindgomyces ingoldianus TaxID=673940 RepID=A0ACB6QQ55_9PLEO|nr:uncharacterized protein BDR25DRAFT_356785 [Lindgomyces ingoldianus]KAF2469020.1 hypothetical protein BDR25DRAFT_356785 [Lindgomyces ingoldianus]